MLLPVAIPFGDGGRLVIRLISSCSISGKAYLPVHVAPELQRYQVLVWQGELFVMERMGFDLSVAPKAMDMIVKFVTCDIASVDNYVDDPHVQKEDIGQVQERLKEFGLPTKPAEVAASSRGLGLQLGTKDDGTVTWRRRDGINLQVPANATKRFVFSWFRRALSHYPICKWLRPACSVFKRLACSSEKWDDPVVPQVQQLLQDLHQRLMANDPAHGEWHVDINEPSGLEVYCNASDLVYGVVLKCNGVAVEDRSWLRAKNDKRHINVAELDAVIKALDLVVDWSVCRVCIKTDRLEDRVRVAESLAEQCPSESWWFAEFVGGKALANHPRCNRCIGHRGAVGMGTQRSELC